MSESIASLGSMHGMHTTPHPPVSRECEEYEHRVDRAQCAMCNALHQLDLYPQHGALQEDSVEQLVLLKFAEQLERDEDSVTCPFPKEMPCTLLKRKKRPPSK